MKLNENQCRNVLMEETYAISEEDRMVDIPVKVRTLLLSPSFTPGYSVHDSAE